MGKVNFTKVLIFIFIFSQISLGWNLSTQAVTSQGQEIELDKENVLLYFWATWCPDCKHTLQTVLPKFDTKNLQIISVNTDVSDKDIEQYRQDNKIIIVSISDEDKKIRKQFKVYSVPTAVLLKKDKDQWIAQKTYIGDEIKTIMQDLPVVKK